MNPRKVNYWAPVVFLYILVAFGIFTYESKWEIVYFSGIAIFLTWFVFKTYRRYM